MALYRFNGARLDTSVRRSHASPCRTIHFCLWSWGAIITDAVTPTALAVYHAVVEQVERPQRCRIQIVADTVSTSTTTRHDATVKQHVQRIRNETFIFDVH